MGKGYITRIFRNKFKVNIQFKTKTIVGREFFNNQPLPPPTPGSVLFNDQLHAIRICTVYSTILVSDIVTAL